MDSEKAESLLKWVSILVKPDDQLSLETFSDGILLLQLLKLIDKDAWTEEYGNDASARVECIYTYLQGLYGDVGDIVNKTAVLAGDKLEIIKLLIIILVCAVNSDNVHQFVEPILTLPKTVQTNIMTIIEPINNREPSADLNELLLTVLSKPATDEESQVVRSPSSYIFSPDRNGPFSPYPSFVGSPAVGCHVRNNSHSSSIGADSPFRFMASPHLINKKELFEKNKLNVKIRRLMSSVTTQGHVIDDLEHRLVETNKKNEMLETINTDLKQRLKSFSTLQEEVDSLKMLAIENRTKQLDNERVNQQLANLLKENASLKEELEQVKINYEEEERKFDEFDKMKKQLEVFAAKEMSFEVEISKLASSLIIKKEELDRVTSEKNEQLDEISEYVKFLQEKVKNLEANEDKKDSFVIIGQDTDNLKNELLVEEIKKSKEDISAYKEKYEDSRKIVFVLKNELNEKSSANLSLSKELENRNSCLEELKKVYSDDKRKAKESEESLLSKIAILKATKEEIDAVLRSAQDEAHKLKREKGEISMKYDHQIDMMERSIQDGLMKIKSTELVLANLSQEKDGLEKICKDQVVEHKKKLKKIEECHQVECYKLKGEYEKQISELKEFLQEKSMQNEIAEQNNQRLHKSKRSDDEIYMNRITALLEERENAISAIKTTMEEKMNDVITEKVSITTDYENLKKEIVCLKDSHTTKMKELTEASDQRISNLNAELAEITRNLNDEIIPEFERKISDYNNIVEEKEKECGKIKEDIELITTEKNAKEEEIDVMKQKLAEERLTHERKVEEINAALEKEKDERQRSLESFEMERCELKNYIDKANEQSDKAQENVNQLETMLATEENSRKLQNEELDRVKTNLAEEGEKIMMLEECEITLKQEIISLEASIEVKERESKIQIEELERVKTELTGRDSKIVVLVKCEQDMKQEIQGLKDSIEVKEQECRRQSEELEKVKIELAGRDNKIDELVTCEQDMKQEIQDLNDNIAAKEQECTKQNEELDKVKTELKERDNKIDELVTCEQDMKQEIQDLNDNIAAKEQECTVQNEELDKVKTELKERDNKIDELVTCEQDMKQEIQDLNDNIAAKEQECTVQNEELDKVKTELKERDNKIDELVTCEQDMKQEIQDLKDSIAAKEQECIIQNGELDKVKTELKERDNKIDELVTCEQDMKQEIKDLKDSIAAKEQECIMETGELQKVKEELVKRENKIDELVICEQNMKNEIKDLTVSIKVNEQESKLKSEELEKVKMELIAEKKNWKALEESTQSKIMGMVKSFDDLEILYTASQADLQKAEERINEEQKIVNSLKAEIELLKSEYEKCKTELEYEWEKTGEELKEQKRIFVEHKAENDFQKASCDEINEKIKLELEQTRKEKEDFKQKHHDLLLANERETKEFIEYKEATSSDLAAKGEQIRMLEDQNETLVKEKCHIEDKFSAAEKLAEAKEFEVHEYRNKVEHIQSANEQEKEKFATNLIRKCDEIKELEQKQESLLKTNSEVEEKLTEVKQRAEAKDFEILEYKNHIGNIESAFEKEKDEAKSVVLAKSQKIQELTEKHESTINKCLEIEEKLTSAQKFMEAKDSEILEYKNQIGDIKSVFEKEKDETKSELLAKSTEIQELTERHESTITKCLEIEEELTSAQKFMEAKDSEIMEYKNQIGDIESAFEKEKDETKSVLLAKSKEIQELTERHESTITKCLEVEEKLTSAQECMEAKDSEILEYKKQIGNIESAFEKEKDETKSELVAKSKEIQELTERHEATINKCLEIEEELTSAQKCMEAKDSEILEYKNQIEIIESVFEKEKDETKSELVAKSNEIQELTERHESTITKCLEVEEKLTSAQKSVEAKDSEILEYKNQIGDIESAFEKEKYETKSELLAKSKDIQELTERHESTITKCLEIEEKLNSAQKSVEAKDSEIMEYKNQIGNIESAFENEKDETKSVLLAKSKEIQGLTERHESMITKCLEIEEKLTSAQKCMEAKDSEILECNAKFESLRSAFEAEKQEFDNTCLKLRDEFETVMSEKKDAVERLEQKDAVIEDVREKLELLSEEKTKLLVQFEEVKRCLDIENEQGLKSKDEARTAMQMFDAEREKLLTERDLLTAQVKKLEGDFEKLELEKELETKKVLCMEEEKEDLMSNHNAEINKLITEKGSILDECKALQSMLKESQKQTEIYREKNDLMNKCVESNRKELDVYKTQVGEMRARCEEKDERLAETKDLLEEAEKELKLQKEKLRRSILTHERELGKLNADSDKIIAGLEKRLAEMAQERNRIEVEKIEFRTMLADMTDTKNKLEAKYVAKEKKLQLVEKEITKLNEELKEERLISRRHGSLLRSKEAELAKSTQSLDNAKEQLTKHEKEIEQKAYRRRTILFGDATDNTMNNTTANLSFDEQSTLVPEEITMKRSPSLSSLNFQSEVSFGGSVTSLGSIDSNDVNFSRNRSIRRQSGIRTVNTRRQSLLYIAGTTPPNRRTTIGAPVPQLPICHMEDEPDILEYKHFDDGFDRMSELNRRNTLCLPHLKSSYPLEMIQTDKTQLNKPERKRMAEEPRNGRPPKRQTIKTSDQNKSNDSTIRCVKSDSSIVTRSMIDHGSNMIWGDSSKVKEDSMTDFQNDPRRESVAFVVSFDDGKKNLKPNASMRRACGSAHLLPSESKESLNETKKIKTKKSDPSTKENIADNKQSIVKNTPLARSKTKNPSADSTSIGKSTPLKRSTSDKTSLKSRTNNLRKSIRRSITSKVRGPKPVV